jgi:hypothetical protein
MKRFEKVIPSQRVREEFYLTYELKGCQKAVNVLARYYRIRRMNVVVDGRRVGNGYDASYECDSHTAYFKKKALHKRNVLHEFYHHLAYAMDWDVSERREEREADRYANRVWRD